MCVVGAVGAVFGAVDSVVLAIAVAVADRTGCGGWALRRRTTAVRHTGTAETAAVHRHSCKMNWGSASP